MTVPNSIEGLYRERGSRARSGNPVVETLLDIIADYKIDGEVFHRDAGRIADFLMSEKCAFGAACPAKEEHR